ncbi:AMP-binding protein [Nocardia sp. NPDC005366]|uniref:class I adenylate-forming enzyme family protein n=1 Tax=Nocardia sp. NPDC005366 TaxID=3156878 RepID=UPI0033A1A81A
MPEAALGATGDRPAIVAHGRAYTYGELDHAIDEWIEGSDAEVYDASDLALADALICVLAAARRGIAVLVENPEFRPRRSSIPESAFLLVATSGSTGSPRPLARTAASWYDSFPAFTAITGVRDNDHVLVTGPLHATMHLFGALHALWCGACVTDDPELATVVHAVPAVLRDVVASAPRLRTAIVAGIALDDGAIAAAGQIEIVEYYGSSEVSLVAARRVPEPLRLLDGVEADVRDGLLHIRSPYSVIGAPGWYAVGDLAELGENGELRVRGRGDCVINVGGTTVIAEDVERVLESLDGIVAVAVIGSPHTVFGEIVTAALELDDAVGLDVIRSTARELLTKEAMPRRWLAVPALPRTASGKVARSQVRELLG